LAGTGSKDRNDEEGKKQQKEENHRMFKGMFVKHHWIFYLNYSYMQWKSRDTLPEIRDMYRFILNR